MTTNNNVTQREIDIFGRIDQKVVIPQKRTNGTITQFFLITIFAFFRSPSVRNFKIARAANKAQTKASMYIYCGSRHSLSIHAGKVANKRKERDNEISKKSDLRFVFIISPSNTLPFQSKLPRQFASKSEYRARASSY